MAKVVKRKIEKVGRVSAESVLKGTGKDWDQWIAILTKAGAKNWSHTETAKYLAKKHKLTAWWQQGVTLGFEVATGKRVNGQNYKGEYTLTVTKSFPIDSKKLWHLLSSPEGIAVWLRPLGDFELKPKQEFEVEGGVFGQVRTIKAPLRARLTWQETDWLKPTTFNIYCGPRGKKSLLVFSHEGLKTARQKEDLRALWKERVEALLFLCDS